MKFTRFINDLEDGVLRLCLNQCRMGVQEMEKLLEEIHVNMEQRLTWQKKKERTELLYADIN